MKSEMGMFIDIYKKSTQGKVVYTVFQYTFANQIKSHSIQYLL